MGFLDFREPVSAWTHFAWMILAIPGTVLLWKRSRDSRTKQISMLIFGLTLIYCFAGSTLFHAVHDLNQIQMFHRADQVGIFLLIAGSYTPAAVVVLRGRWRWGVLSMIWSLSATGIVLRLLADTIADPLGTTSTLMTGLFLAMGWGAVLCYFELARILSHRAMFPVVLGGILYSIGAISNIAHWPVLIPGVFGPHEVFHVFVMAASLTHFWFVLKYVVPYKLRPDPKQLPAPTPVPQVP